MNDYAGQREVIAENMMTGICVELTKYLQDLKGERKTVRKRLGDGKETKWKARRSCLGNPYDVRISRYRPFQAVHYNELTRRSLQAAVRWIDLEPTSWYSPLVC